MRHENDADESDSRTGEASPEATTESTSTTGPPSVKRGAIPTPRSRIDEADEFVPETGPEEGGEGQEEGSATYDP